MKKILILPLVLFFLVQGSMGGEGETRSFLCGDL